MSILRSPRGLTLLCGTLLVSALFSCTQTGSGSTTGQPEPPVVTEVSNTKPTGSLAGRVYDFADGLALSGVQVKVTSGAVTMETMTGMEGEWMVEDLPAGGAVGVFIKKSGYGDARLTERLDDAAGNFPTEHASAFVGPVSLLAPSSGLEVTVLLANGQPAAAVPVYMDVNAGFVVDDNLGNPALRGSTHEMQTTGADGKALFVTLPAPAALATRFPALVARLTVAAPTLAPGQPSYQGVTQDVAFTALLQQQNKVTLVLPQTGSTTALKIVASNMPDLISDQQVQTPGTIAPSGDTESLLRVVFNQPVNPATVEARMVSEDGSPLDPNGGLTRLEVRVPGAMEGMESAPATILELVLPRASPGVEGNLYLRASAATGAQFLVVAVPIYFTQPEALAVRSMKQVTVAAPDGALSASEVVDLFLNQPVGARTANGAPATVGSSRVDLQACKLEYSIVSPK